MTGVRFEFYPAFLDLERRRVVVVGGGGLAASKVDGLLRCGPDPLVVIAPELTADLEVLACQARITWLKRDYWPGDLAGAWLAFGVTEDRAANARVAEEARRGGIPVLCTDDIPNCDFVGSALVRRGSLTIAISTHGRSPAIARFTREWLDDCIPRSWAKLLDIAATARAQLRGQRARISAEAWQAVLRELSALRIDDMTVEDGVALVLRHVEREVAR